MELPLVFLFFVSIVQTHRRFAMSFLDTACKSGEFSCSNGRCIESFWKCDFEDDCGDNSDEIDCSTNDTVPVSLLFANNIGIWKIHDEFIALSHIVDDSWDAITFDYLFHSGTIFWSELDSGVIYRATIDEDSKPVKVIETKQKIDILAVDWIYNHLYYTCARGLTISVTDYNDNITKVLIDGQLEAGSLVLDPIRGFMYWSDQSASHPRIERAGMDGSHRQTIISSDVREPTGLTLDLALNRIYWADARLNTISSCSFDGSHCRVVFLNSEYLQRPVSLTTFDDWIFWIENGRIISGNIVTKDIKAISADSEVGTFFKTNFLS